MSPIEIAKELISVDSVTTHSNAEISELQESMLNGLGFSVERIVYRDILGTDKISLAARKAAGTTTESPGIAYFCHNDVVSVSGWNCRYGGPFEPAVEAGRLWGRGACDMKGPTAAAFAALLRLADAEQKAPIYFFITGDEECGMAGATGLVSESEIFRGMLAKQPVGIIGEPTELRVVNSHKGGCHFDVSSHGVVAHSSTNDGLNANWQLIPFLNYLQTVAQRCATDPSLCNSQFSNPTLSLNIVVDNEPAAFNITVGRAICHIFFRPMPSTDWETLLEEIKRKARELELEVSSIRCLHPLHTQAERPFVQTALRLAGQDSPDAVCFATDGCCFEQLQDLLVVGPGSIEQAHRSDEWIALDQLQAGSELYEKLFFHYAYGGTED